MKVQDNLYRKWWGNQLQKSKRISWSVWQPGDLRNFEWLSATSLSNCVTFPGCAFQPASRSRGNGWIDPRSAYRVGLAGCGKIQWVSQGPNESWVWWKVSGIGELGQVKVEVSGSENEGWKLRLKKEQPAFSDFRSGIISRRFETMLRA